LANSAAGTHLAHAAPSDFAQFDASDSLELLLRFVSLQTCYDNEAQLGARVSTGTFQLPAAAQHRMFEFRALPLNLVARD